MTSRKANSCRNRELPFYDVGKDRKTSAQIVSEARASIRTLKTSRPRTPATADRSLMGKERPSIGRPPSVFSIGQRHFLDEQSRPDSSNSGSTGGLPLGRLAPLEQRPVAELEGKTICEAPLVPRPPSKAKPNSSGRHASGGRLRTGIRDIEEETSPSELRSLSASAVGKQSNRVGSVEQFVMPKPPIESQSPKSSRSKRLQQADKVEQNVSPRIENGKVRECQKERKMSDGNPSTDVLYEKRVRPILERLNATEDKSHLHQTVSELYSILEEGNLLGRGAGKRRSTILRTVFQLLDIDDPRLLLGLSRLILSLHVTGTNLTNTCKLLFKLSKTELHDLLFLEEKLCGSMLAVVRMSDPVTYCEALVYCVGTLKLLSGNAQLQKELGERGCIEALSELIASINRVSEDDGRTLSPYTGSLLVQVTATLRNLADVSDRRNDFLSGFVIENMCPLMDTFGDDADLMLNVSRILSKLTQHSSCKTVLCRRPSSLQSMLRLVSQHISNQDLVVRLCFVLGNLTSRDDAARAAIYFTCHGMDTLMQVFCRYVELDEQASVTAENGEASGITKKKLSPTEDVLVKLVRVIANLAVHPDVGPAIASSESCLDNLIQLLGYKDVAVCEELVLNVVATVNNLSFYAISGTAVKQKQLAIADLLVDILLSESMDAMVEAFRVFGNLSRSREVRQMLAARQVDRMLVTVLDSGRREVVYSSCGVLVNMMADPENWKTLREEDGVRKLIDILRDFGQLDWQLGSLVCKVLSNFSVKMTSSNEWFGNDHALTLINILSDQLDEESALSLHGDVSKDIRDFLGRTWTDEFCPVAQNLLARIQLCYSELEPL